MSSEELRYLCLPQSFMLGYHNGIQNEMVCFLHPNKLLNMTEKD